MNGNITKEGITADLEAMKQIGLGGATVVVADCKIPRGDVLFMSPAWRDCFKFAVQEAGRLGLDLSVENCAGWANSGGPWNTPEHGMQRVTTSELRVTGPANFNAALPQPATVLDFYRDIAVVAFPAPAGEAVNMKEASPDISTSDGASAVKELTDRDVSTLIPFPALKPGNPCFVQMAFPAAFAAGVVKLSSGAGFPSCNGQILVSDDGAQYRSVKSFALSHTGSATQLISLGTNPVSARFWRVQIDKITKPSNEGKNTLAEIELLPQINLDQIDAKAGFDGSIVLSDRANITTTAGIVQRRDMVDLTGKMTADGKLNWKVPAGNWVIMRFGHTPTGKTNHPAPEEGTGLECDKMSKIALDRHWDGFMQKILDDIGPLAGKTLTTSLLDSYEVGAQNWTPEFREEFRKRRGYDLLTFLPAFTGRVVESPAVSERFLWDVRRTIADLFAENYYGHFAELCKTHGLLNAVEPYGGPFEALQSGAPADVVMGEFWVGKPVSPTITLAASIANSYGKSIVGAEAFTAWPQEGSWKNDPYALKMLGDAIFASGVNRYIFHRFAMQPWTNRVPGMTMGRWGFHFDRTVTWWNQGKPWMEYIARSQFLLQQGRVVADVACFTGESAPSNAFIKGLKRTPGYCYDAVNADVLLQGATVKNGRLTLASGANYAALILPEDDPDMTPQLVQRIAELVRAGATVVGAPPQRSPSLAGFPECDQQVQKLAKEVWGACDGKTVLENPFGQGRVVRGKPLTEIFAAQKLAPDFEFKGADAKTKLVFIHRVTKDADLYFVSNQRQQADSADCTFRVSGKTPELWHADTGLIERAPVWHEQDGRTTVRLTFDPAGSVFVVFRKAAAGDQVVAVKADPQWQVVSGATGELLVKATSNGTAEFKTVKGKTMQAVAANVPAPQAVTGSWTLSFPPNLGAPASVALDKLISWTEHTDSGVKYFSGTARYEKEITVPAGRLQAGRELWLDLGQVKNIAEVSLNGKELGILWKPPFRMDITEAAKPGVNKLVVKITNLWPNRLIGDEQLPPDSTREGDIITSWPQWLLDGKPSPSGRLTFATWQPWKKGDKLLESGLLGPVRLQTAEILPAK